MFKKFVQITALFNFPIALGMIISVMIAPQADTFIITVVLGASFMLMGLHYFGPRQILKPVHLLSFGTD
ncbi:hypothetical protein ACOYR1_15535 [Thalassotalea piscium]